MHVGFKNYLQNTGVITSSLLTSLRSISVSLRIMDAYLNFVLFYRTASLLLALLSVARSI